MELVSLNDRAIQSAEILRNNTNNDTMDLTVIFDINEVQIISEELTILTNTSGRPLVPNDLNTSNSVLSSLIRQVIAGLVKSGNVFAYKYHIR